MMKRIFIFSFLVVSFSLNAQDSTTILLSKRGEPILPQAKEWGIGVDATPMFNYIANLNKGIYDKNLPTITGKYFKDAQTAYRVSLRFGVTTKDTLSRVMDRNVTPGTQQVFAQPSPTKENSWKRSGTNIGLSMGIEKRRGKTRLQGFYGGEVGLYFSSSKDKFSYGNALSTTGNMVNVSSEDAFRDANNVDSLVQIQAKVGYARVTQRKNGLSFTFGARAFAGAEYFVLPKLSIGAEFGWGLAFTSYGRSVTTYESKGTSTSGTSIIAPTDVTNKKGSSFKLDNSSLNALWGSAALLKVLFYF